jgi:S-methylmethionine-dependent homocysteine/selenocysteine methylase
MSFIKIITESRLVLTEGALVERLKTEFNLKMDDNINHAGLIYDEFSPLEKLYRQYIEIAVKYNLPIMLMTPTRRVNVDTVDKSSFKNKNLISDSCTYLQKIKNSYPGFAHNILIGGLLGCKGDAYSGEKVLNIDDAYHFHKHQTDQFPKEKTDFLFAGIMPEINEAIGMAKAMSETNIPYIISFMVQKNGRLLDGTAISAAIQIIDEQTNPKPTCYFTNCIHPTNLIEALTNVINKDKPLIKRLTGIQANASALSCIELNNCGTLQQDSFDNIIEQMCFLQKNFGLTQFGGCCGTDDTFMEKLAMKLTNIVHHT